jgi:hypothetical protein
MESRNRGSLSVVAIAWPAQLMAMQTGIRTMASVFILSLKADSQLKLRPSLEINPNRRFVTFLVPTGPLVNSKT